MGFNFGSFAGGAAQGFRQTYELFKDQERRDALLKLEQEKEGRAKETFARESDALTKAGEVPLPGSDVMIGSPMEVYRTQGAGAEQAAAIAAQENFSNGKPAFGGVAQPEAVAGLRSVLSAETPMPPSRKQTNAGYTAGIAAAMAGSKPIESAALMSESRKQGKEEHLDELMQNGLKARATAASYVTQLQEKKLTPKAFAERINGIYQMSPDGHEFVYQAPTDDTPEAFGLRNEETGETKFFAVNPDTIAKAGKVIDNHLKESLRTTLGFSSPEAHDRWEKSNIARETLGVHKQQAATQEQHRADQAKKDEAEIALINKRIESGDFGMADYRKAQIGALQAATARERGLDKEKQAAYKAMKEAKAAYDADPTASNSRKWLDSQHDFMYAQGKGGLLEDEFDHARTNVQKGFEALMKTGEVAAATKFRDEQLAEINAQAGVYRGAKSFAAANADIPDAALDKARDVPFKEWKIDADGNATVKVDKYTVKVPKEFSERVRLSQQGAAAAPKGGPVAAAAAKATGGVRGPTAEQVGAAVQTPEYRAADDKRGQQIDAAKAEWRKANLAGNDAGRKAAEEKMRKATAEFKAFQQKAFSQ